MCLYMFSDHISNLGGVVFFFSSFLDVDQMFLHQWQKHSRKQTVANFKLVQSVLYCSELSHQTGSHSI